MPKTAGPPTKMITVNVPVDLLDRIDADWMRRGKKNRTAWFVDLAAAVLDGRLTMAPKGK